MSLLFAQQSSSPAGDYYLQGVREVGSGFTFNADHTFQFFFSYGALDRVATGTWAQRGDSLILNNEKKPPQDFKLVQVKKINGAQIVIQLKDSNAYILRYLYAELKCAGGTQQAQSNGQGRIVFEKCAGPLQLSLIHEFWAERFSVFELPEGDYFEFTLEPWITTVAFENLVLVLKDGELTGPHPLLKPGTYTYSK